MELNKEDYGTRQFIGIQLNEKSEENKTFENGTIIKTVDQVTIERIRRIIQGTDSLGNIIDKVNSLPNNNLIVHKIIEKDIAVSNNNRVVYNFKNGVVIKSYKFLNSKIDLNEIYKLGIEENKSKIGKKLQDNFVK